ncbi:MAG: outer membrane protein [Hyphomicrobiaceae bacterium]
MLFAAHSVAIAGEGPASGVGSSSGFYASVHGGWFVPDDPGVSFRWRGWGYTGKVAVEDGYRFGGALGYDFNRNFAAELQASWIHNDHGDIRVSLPFPPYVDVTAANNGTGRAFTIMSNAIVGEHFGAWRPYAGIGVGAARVSLEADFASGLDDNDWALAAQAFVGLDYRLTNRLSIGGRYSYLHIGPTNYMDKNNRPVKLHGVDAGNFELNLKYRFGG